MNKLTTTSVFATTTLCIVILIAVVEVRLCCEWSKKFEVTSSPLFAGVPLSTPEAQEHLPSACEADHQSRRPMGESNAARNPEGGRLASKRG